MQSFSQHRFALVEDEALDKMFRAKALEAYQKIKSRLDVVMQDPSKYFFARNDGGLICPHEYLGLGHTVEGPLYFLFLPQHPTMKGGLGFFDGVPVLVFYCLYGPHDSRFLNTRFNKDVFIHEFIHYLDWKRTGRRIGGNASKNLDRDPDNVQSWQDYYNSPAEFNAYYQEATSQMERMALAAPYSALIVLYGKNVHEFIRLSKEKHFADGFVDALNPEYLRKLEKRLARFYVETLQPIIQQRSEEIED